MGSLPLNQCLGVVVVVVVVDVIVRRYHHQHELCV